jgi:hypothetical protein
VLITAALLSHSIRRKWWYEQEAKAEQERERNRRQWEADHWEEIQKERRKEEAEQQRRREEQERIRQERDQQEKRRKEEEARQRQRREEEEYRRRQEEYRRRKEEQRNKDIVYCQLLQIPFNASKQTISNAYRRLALLYHPDRNPPEKWEWAHEMFRNLTEAYTNVLLSAT